MRGKIAKLLRKRARTVGGDKMARTAYTNGIEGKTVKVFDAVGNFSHFFKNPDQVVLDTSVKQVYRVLKARYKGGFVL